MYEFKTFGRLLYARPTQVLHAFLYLILLAPVCAGQSTDTLSTDSLYFHVSVPQVTLDEGDSVVATVLLGSSSAPLTAALFFDLSIELTENAQFPVTPASSMDDAWFNPDGLVTQSHSADSSASTIRLRATRPLSSPVSGYGELICLTLISAEDNVEAADLFRSNAGGIIVVDNLEMKRPGESLPAIDAASPIAYPNPCRETLTLRMPEDQGGQAVLRDMSGRVLRRASLAGGQVHQFHLGGLPSGSYLLTISSPNCAPRRQRVLLAPQ